ncbi:MAG TPA: YDG domain-containing protein [Bacteroidales bacterium]|nr:YDG domain-containing protein [Bacteroidales bacterium]
MKTKYEFNRLLRSGTLLAFLFAWMLMGSFEAKAQTQSLHVTISGVGQVTVDVPPAYLVQGPVAGSLVGNFGTNTVITVTAVGQNGFTFAGWSSAPAVTFTPSASSATATFVLSGNIHITASFVKTLTLTGGPLANNKVYDGNTTAVIGTWGTLTGIDPAYPLVTLNTAGHSATFDNKDVGNNKPVTVTGLSLSGLDAGVYTLPPSFSTQANITPLGITVTGAAANNKIFDNTTTASIDLTGASLVGVIAPDVVTFAVNTANFNNVNVGVAKPVTVTYTLGGADAGNYTVTGPALSADITAKEIFLNAVLIQSKPYDGNTTATITSLGAITGIVPPGTGAAAVTVSGGTATFADANVGTGKTVNVSGVTVSNPNYFLSQPFTTTGTITPGVYAMFNPSYGIVGPRPVSPVNNVPVNEPLWIEFNVPVVDINGDPLPTTGLGDFVKLEVWNTGTLAWDPVTFSANRVGNKINIVPASTLAYSTQYRIRFLNIYKTAAHGGGQVVYSLDKGPSGFDPTISVPFVALQADPDRAVVFNTMSLLTATLPTVTPYGTGKGVCDQIKLTFVNPVQYLNGNQITDNPKHKFTLEESTDGITWNPVPTADWSVAVNVPGNPTEFTFTYNPGPLKFNTFYRIVNNVGLDVNYGFTDKVTSFNLLNGPINYAHTQGVDGWNWKTVATYPLIVDVAPWPQSPVFPSVPLPNYASFNGVPNVTVGPAPTYTLTKNTAYTADVTLTYPMAATNGEGWHWVNWSRTTNGSTWTTLASTPPMTPALGVNWAPQSWTFNANDLKPTTCTQQIGYKANFEINKYNVTTSVTPNAAWGTVTGAANNINHGTTVNLTATPAAGYYLAGWNTAALPPSVAATVVSNVPDHTAVGYPNFISNVGTLSFDLVGPLTHNSTWNIQAIFAKFEPTLYAATDPQNAFTGIVQVTKEFGSAPTLAFGTDVFQTLTYKWEQYDYNTSVRLEALGADCRYVFVKWQIWNPNGLGSWQDYSTTNPTAFFPVNANIRIKAVYKLKDDIQISAVAKVADRGTVVVFSDPARTNIVVNGNGEQLINNLNGHTFTWNTPLYITTYSEPDYFPWKWEDANGVAIPMGTNPGQVQLNGTFQDRREWTYYVGCTGVDLKMVFDLKEYTVISRTLATAQGNTNLSTPAFVAGTGYQGGLGFQFTNVGLGRKGEGFFQRNSSVTFRATAATNWAFDYWELGDGAGNGTGTVVSNNAVYTISSLQGPVELIARWYSTLPPPPTYPLTVNVTPGSAGTTTLTSGNYLPGPQTIQANAAPGWTFVNWTATGITLTPGQQVANPMTFTMPAGPVTLTANFVQTQYTLTPVSRTYLRPHTAYTIVNYGGTVARTPATGTFTAGQTVLLSATPNPGFRFVNWMVGQIMDPGPDLILRGVQVSDQPTFTYTIPAVPGNPPMFVYAIFVEIALPEYPTYTLNTVANPAGFGTVTGAGTYAHGVEVNVTQTVTQPGYTFSHWSPNVIGGSYVQMDMSKTAIANYVPIVYTLNVNTNNPAWGTVMPTTTTFTVNDNPIPISAITNPSTCDENYVFQGWFTNPGLTTPLLDAGNNPVTSANFNFIPFALTPPATTYNIYAKFAPVTKNYSVSADINLAAAGSVSVSPAGPYVNNQTVVISTTPNPGYQFQHWTDGNLFITQLSFNHTINCANAAFTAVYVPIDYTVAATAGTGGTVAPATQIKNVGNAVEVVATANTGWQFAGWTATGVTLTPAQAASETLNFTMPASNVTLNATFTKINYTVAATAGTGGNVAPANQTATIGDAVTVTATPLAGYTFGGWTATGVTLTPAQAAAATLNFTMPANNVTLEAAFNAIPYTVTLNAVPSNGGTFSAINPNYTVGQSVSVTATANPGFVFSGWTASGVTLGNPSNASQTFNMPANNVTLTANFTAVNNKIMGQVRYFNQFESGLPFSANVKVALYDGSTLVGGPVSLTTNGSYTGYYEFVGIIPGVNYTLRVWEDDATLASSWGWNNWGGVSAADALIASYMIADNPIVENFPWIAPVTVMNQTAFAKKVADVNGSNTLTSVDPLIMMYRSVGLPGYSMYPNNVPNFQVAAGQVSALGVKTYPQAPSIVFAANGTYAAGTAGSAFYYTGNFVGQSGDNVMNIYFVAGGDVNASYVPAGGAKKAMNLNYNGVINAKAGEVVRIPVRLSNATELGAYNLGINFNNQLIKVLDVEGAEVVNVNNANGTVRVAWMDRNARSFDNLVVLVAEVLAGIPADVRYMELDATTELADANAQTVEGVSLATVAINGGTANTGDVSSLSLVAFPNPFNNVATLSYELPESGKVSIVVYNKLGQAVKTLVNEVQAAGAHTVQLRASDLNGHGAYIYRITVEGNARTYSSNGTLILVK